MFQTVSEAKYRNSLDRSRWCKDGPTEAVAQALSFHAVYKDRALSTQDRERPPSLC